MEPEANKMVGPPKFYTFELSFENDLDQDELNRTHRKPGDPPYDPTAKWMDPPRTRTANGDGSASAETADQ